MEILIEQARISTDVKLPDHTIDRLAQSAATIYAQC